MTGHHHHSAEGRAHANTAQSRKQCKGEGGRLWECASGEQPRVNSGRAVDVGNFKAPILVQLSSNTGVSMHVTVMHSKSYPQAAG